MMKNKSGNDSVFSRISAGIADQFNGIMFFCLITTDIPLMIDLINFNNMREGLYYLIPEGNAVLTMLTGIVDAIDRWTEVSRDISYLIFPDQLTDKIIVFASCPAAAILSLLRMDKLLLIAAMVTIAERTVIKRGIIDCINRCKKSGENRGDRKSVLGIIALFCLVQLFMVILESAFWIPFFVDLSINAAVCVLIILLIRLCIACFFKKYLFTIIVTEKKTCMAEAEIKKCDADFDGR